MVVRNSFTSSTSANRRSVRSKSGIGVLTYPRIGLSLGVLVFPMKTSVFLPATHSFTISVVTFGRAMCFFKLLIKDERIPINNEFTNIFSFYNSSSNCCVFTLDGPHCVSHRRLVCHGSFAAEIWCNRGTVGLTLSSNSSPLHHIFCRFRHTASYVGADA